MSIQEHIQSFEKTVSYLAGELDGLTGLWQFNLDDLDEVRFLQRIPWVTRSAAVDAVVVMKYFRKTGTVTQQFSYLATNVYDEFGFCEQSQQALLIWNLITVRAHEHIRKHKQMPYRIDAMLMDFIQDGDINEDKVY